jgi:hypothetical protein
MRSFQEYVGRKTVEHGPRFDKSDLDPRFVRHFETGDRVKVRTCGMVMTGTVGVTTGWRPAFLLTRTRRSIGSPWTLGPRDEILGVRQGRVWA